MVSESVYAFVAQCLSPPKRSLHQRPRLLTSLIPHSALQYDGRLGEQGRNSWEVAEVGSGERDREERIVVCLAYPALMSSRYIERLRAIDPRIEAIVLPVDPGTAWYKATAGVPHDEPPTWAQGVAAERLRTLERAEAMIALHIPKNLPALSPRLRWLQGIGAGVEQFVASGIRHGEVVVTNASGLGRRRSPSG